jgi:hypothetical protein
MVILSPQQLGKPYHSNHEFYSLYQDRGERFLEKIEKQEPFEITDGSSVIINKFSPGVEFLKNKQYKELGGGKRLFIGEENKLLALSDFIKTKEFGSSSGQGGGSKNTAIQESTQCVFNSMLRSLEKTYLNIEDITKENISSSYQYCDTTTPWENIYEFSQIPSWQQSFLTSSNLLSQYIEETEYENHRDSSFISSIYSSYKQTNTGYQSDKWNPSDIWLVKESVNNTLFSSSLDELNMQLENMFDKKELIGISLKKTGKDSKIEIKNKSGMLKKQYSYEGYKTTSKSKDITLLYNEGKICFRTFNYATNWAGEILGKTANHGKIGFGPINKILKNNNISELDITKNIKQLIEEDKTGTNLLFFSLFNDYIPVGGNFNIFIQDKTIDWKVSKLLGLLLLEKIENQPKEIQDKIITELILYASSESNESSVFLKIS